MIQIPAQTKIITIPKNLLFHEGLDDVIAICKKYSFDPFSGAIFVFKNKDSTHIGLLTYDGHGFQWCIKRFSEGKLAWWPSNSEATQILARDLQIMMWGGHPKQFDFPEMWRPIHSTDNKS